MRSGFDRHPFLYTLSFPRLEPERLDAFSLEALRPVLDGAKGSGLLRSWFYETGAHPSDASRTMFYAFLRPARGVEIGALERALDERFAPFLRSGGGRVDRALELPEAEYWSERFGGRLGAALYEAFAVRQSRWLLDLLGEWTTNGRPFERSQLALAACLFQLENLALSREDAVLGLRAWMDGFARLKKLEKQLPALNEAAAAQLRQPALLDWLAAVERGENEALAPQARRHARPFRRLGRILASSLGLSAPRRGYMLLHAYVHVGFLKLGVRNMQELLIEALALAWLERGAKKAVAGPKPGDGSADRGFSSRPRR